MKRLSPLLAALEAQTFPPSRREILLAFDGIPAGAAPMPHAERLGVRTVATPERRGPGAARNAGARAARGEWLAFTEDDCTPAPDWLEAAAARLESDPSIDVLEGATLLPGGAPARRRVGGRPTWLPTNLFVRRELFERVGGYCESFFEPRSGIYFREDSDFGFSLAEAGARTAVDAAPRVTHPREHASWLDPLRWARRYEMDPLLRARHPAAYHEQIEVLGWGPLRLRRPFVRACVGYVVALAMAAAAAILGETGVAAWLLGVALLLAFLIWGKWRWDPRKLPAALLVPPVLLASLASGRARARRYLVASRTTR